MKGTEAINGYEIASRLGMNSKDPVKVLEFLRKVPAEKLVELNGQILTLQVLSLIDEPLLYFIIESNFSRTLCWSVTCSCPFTTRLTPMTRSCPRHWTNW